MPRISEPFVPPAWALAVVALVWGALLAGCGAGEGCRMETRELANMTVETIAFTLPDGRKVYAQAWIADEPEERYAGFQYLCPETVRRRPMWFEFGRPTRVGFHMRNVHEPLEVAFIGENGRITEILRMDLRSPDAPGRNYGPQQPIVAAVEAGVGWFQAQGIQAGARATRPRPRPHRGSVGEKGRTSAWKTP